MKTCKYPNCNDIVIEARQARYCQEHSKMSGMIRRREMFRAQGILCTVPHCPQPLYSRGYCSNHYTRVILQGLSPEPLRLQGPLAPCEFGGCRNIQESLKIRLCHAHAMMKWKGRELKPLKGNGHNPVVNGMKTCHKCGETKRLDEFYVRTRFSKPLGQRVDQIIPDCKECRIKTSAEWQQRNRGHGIIK